MIEPFKFCSRFHLSELTGLRAATIGQLSALIKEVPGSSIYYHTHRFLQQHQYLSPEPPNDFAAWVADVLGEGRLGEELSSIDTIQFSTIRGLRERIAGTIDAYLNSSPMTKLKVAGEGEEFHFMKAVSFVLATNHTAHTLEEFAEILKKISVDSIYFHIFEARLRLEKDDNDFSNWIANCVGDKQLANRISRLDPYTFTLEDLRKTIIEIIKKRAPA